MLELFSYRYSEAMLFVERGMPIVLKDCRLLTPFSQ
jgi:hypothetical protein